MGFFGPLMEFGGWGAASLSSTVLSVGTGVATNMLNIAASASQSTTGFPPADTTSSTETPAKTQRKIYAMPSIQPGTFTLFPSSI